MADRFLYAKNKFIVPSMLVTVVNPLNAHLKPGPALTVMVFGEREEFACLEDLVHWFRKEVSLQIEEAVERSLS